MKDDDDDDDDDDERWWKMMKDAGTCWNMLNNDARWW